MRALNSACVQLRRLGMKCVSVGTSLTKHFRCETLARFRKKIGGEVKRLGLKGNICFSARECESTK